MVCPQPIGRYYVTLLRKVVGIVFFGHALFEEYAAENRQAAEAIRKLDRRAQLLLDAVELLKVFSEWGLGECLYSVPEYSVVLRLFRRPRDKSVQTVLDAVAILKEGRGGQRYTRALATIREANQVSLGYRKELPNFPPRPVVRTLPRFFDDKKYPGIDHVAALELARQRGCETGSWLNS